MTRFGLCQRGLTLRYLIQTLYDDTGFGKVRIAGYDRIQHGLVSAIAVAELLQEPDAAPTPVCRGARGIWSHAARTPSRTSVIAAK